MFERFTDRARRTVVLAQEEARRLNHNYIGTEHILLGLLMEDHGMAGHALAAMEIDLAELRQEIEALTGRGDRPPSGHIPFTPPAKKTLELALRESVQLAAGYIGTEHLLLGLIREGEGPGAQVLTAHGITLDGTRETVVRLLRERGGEGHQGLRLTAGGTTLDELAAELRSIGRRLSAIEAKLGIETPPALALARKLEADLARVRRAKEQAVDRQDFDLAAGLRDQEKQLLTEHKQAEEAWLSESGPPSPGAESA